MTLTELKDRDTCPGCGADRRQLQADLDSPLEWVFYPNIAMGGFMGKSQRQIEAEVAITRCPLCLKHFGWTNKEKGKIIV